MKSVMCVRYMAFLQQMITDASFNPTVIKKTYTKYVYTIKKAWYQS